MGSPSQCASSVSPRSHSDNSGGGKSCDVHVQEEKVIQYNICKHMYMYMYV